MNNFLSLNLFSCLSSSKNSYAINAFYMNGFMSGHWGEIEELFIGFFCISNRNNNSYFLKMKKKSVWAQPRFKKRMDQEWLKSNYWLEFLSFISFSLYVTLRKSFELISVQLWLESTYIMQNLKIKYRNIKEMNHFFSLSATVCKWILYSCCCCC